MSRRSPVGGRGGGAFVKDPHQAQHLLNEQHVLTPNSTNIAACAVALCFTQ